MSRQIQAEDTIAGLRTLQNGQEEMSTAEFRALLDAPKQQHPPAEPSPRKRNRVYWLIFVLGLILGCIGGELCYFMRMFVFF